MRNPYKFNCLIPCQLVVFTHQLEILVNSTLFECSAFLSLFFWASSYMYMYANSFSVLLPCCTGMTLSNILGDYTELSFFMSEDNCTTD